MTIKNNKINTSTSTLEYVENIIYVRIKENAKFSPDSIQENIKAQQQLTGNDLFAVLVNGTNIGRINPATMKHAGEYSPVNRKAIAIVTNRNFVTILMANIYIKFTSHITPTKLFNKESEAEVWLKDMLKR